MPLLAGEQAAQNSHPPADCRSGFASIWLPWLAAPLFALLPLAGCWLAGHLHQPISSRGQHQRPELATSAAPMATLVTVATHR